MLIIALFIVAPTGHGQAQDLNGQEPSRSARPDKSERPGLLVLSHGAPMPLWNGPVQALVNKVRELNKKEKIFHAVEGAFLEFAQPDAAAGVKKLEEAGCDRIIVVPLFVAPSSHSHFDVPAMLGLYTSPDIRQALEKEGARVAEPNVPVTVTQTLSEGDILDQFARDEVRALSKDPANEAIVLLAHGCPDHYRLVDMMVRRVAAFCCGQCGIDYADWAYCAMGQTYLEEALPALIRGSEKKKRVLVVGLYVSSSAQWVHERAMKRASGPIRTAIEDALEGTEIVFSKRGIVDHDATANWVLQTAANALNAVMGHVMQHSTGNEKETPNSR
jgi:hypothetical protein